MIIASVSPTLTVCQTPKHASAYISSFNPSKQFSELNTILMPILQMKKSKPKKRLNESRLHHEEVAAWISEPRQSSSAA